MQRVVVMLPFGTDGIQLSYGTLYHLKKGGHTRQKNDLLFTC